LIEQAMFLIPDSMMMKGRVVTLGMLILTALPFCGTESGSRDEAPLFTLPAWQDVGLEYGDQLMLRESVDGDALLLKHSRRDTIYKYDPSTHSLTAVSNAEWLRTNTPIAECGKQGDPSPLLLKIETASHQLFAGDRPIKAAGRTALKLTEAPSGKFAAVLSASGNADTSIIPFTGGSGASGQYYHQIMSLPDVQAVGQPVRLPVRRKNDSLIPCWSADERYVIYHQVTFNYLSIVTTDLSSSN
jgi:hypothetical protein